MAGDFLQGHFLHWNKALHQSLHAQKERPPHEQVTQDEFLFTRVFQHPPEGSGLDLVQKPVSRTSLN